MTKTKPKAQIKTKSYAIKCRVYPNEDQIRLLNLHFGHCRYVYNNALAKAREGKWSRKTASSALPVMKKAEDTVWLKEVNSQCLQQSINDLHRGFVSFFEKRSRYPRLKKKGKKDSFRIPQRFSIDSDNGTVKLPNIGVLRFKKHRHIPLDSVNYITVSRTKSGKIFVSFCITEQAIEGSAGIYKYSSVGIDLGLKDFIVDSRGNKVKNPKFLEQSLKKIKRKQRRFSKSKKLGKNREKRRIRLAKEYEKLTSRKQDFLHKLSKKYTDENQVVCIETLNVQGMLKNRKWSRHIGQSSFGEFVRQLQYKANWKGGYVVRVDRWYPSSKTCGKCGVIYEGLTLNERTWTCLACGTNHDRDLNAARNIEKEGLANFKIRSERPESTPLEIEPLLPLASVSEASSVEELGSLRL